MFSYWVLRHWKGLLGVFVLFREYRDTDIILLMQGKNFHGPEDALTVMASMFKDIYVYPLVRDVRRRLSAIPRSREPGDENAGHQ